MKFGIRTIALILAVLTGLSLFAACDNGGKTESSETVDVETEYVSKETVSGGKTETDSEEETERRPEVEKNNYGAEFYLSVYEGSNPMKYYWVEESENDVMSEAIFNRQEKVRLYLGVEIIATGAGSFMTYADPFKTAIKNKDGSVDTLLSHVYAGVAGFASGNYLADIAECPGINIDADHWNSDFMESVSLNGRYYLGFSDYNILYTHLIVFNKDIMAKYADSLEMSVYEMVDNYKWTVDEMIKLANLVYIDATSDGKTPDDTFGITGGQWNEFPGFLHGCNINIIEPDDSGAYVVSVMNDKNAMKASQLVDKLHSLSKSDCSFFDFKTTGAKSVPFTTGRTLMYLASTNDLPNYLNYDISFGVLPYPVWDESQAEIGYRHLQWGGYICVPSYVANSQMTGETLDVLAFFSDGVEIAFYEKLLGKQVADMPDDSRMLKILRETVCTEFAQIYSDIITNELLYMMATVTHADTTDNLASFVAARERTVNSQISKYMKKIERVED